MARFVPLGVREPDLYIEAPHVGTPLTRTALLIRAVAGTVVGFAIAVLFSAFLEAVHMLRTVPEKGFDLASPLVTLVQPTDLAGWITLAAIVLFGVLCGLSSAALPAARRGVRR